MLRDEKEEVNIRGTVALGGAHTVVVHILKSLLSGEIKYLGNFTLNCIKLQPTITLLVEMPSRRKSEGANIID